MFRIFRNDAKSYKYRFPVEQEEYTRIVGELLPAILKEIFEEFGCKAELNPVQTNGVDLKVFLEVI